VKILLIDNYDSYTYNIVNCLCNLGVVDLQIVFNDQVTIETANTFDGVIISPGPNIPKASGVILSIIKNLKPSIPLLGICLGHQAIAEVFGGSIYQLEKVYHGQSTKLKMLSNHELFDHITPNAKFGLYHSWAVSLDTLPSALIPTSVSEDGILMSLRHDALPIHGVQFHPESYLSNEGDLVFRNWLRLLSDEN
jgi:anthranilate synthase component II